MVSIPVVFTTHHRRLDDLFTATRRAVENEDWAAASALFLVFNNTIERHMQTEEEYLFPAYERAHGADNPLTGILRKGHKDLRSFFVEIRETIDDGDGGEATALIDTVGQILHHHDTREEDEFYPAVAPLIDDPVALSAALG